VGRQQQQQKQQQKQQQQQQQQQIVSGAQNTTEFLSAVIIEIVLIFDKKAPFFLYSVAVRIIGSFGGHKTFPSLNTPVISPRGYFRRWKALPKEGCKIEV
jgi:hypothetical protein